MVQQYKIDKINYLKDFFSTNKYFIFNDYSGLNVEKITELRDQLRKIDSKFVVIKNNYIYRILKEKILKEEDEKQDIENNLIGPTAVAFANNDINDILKILFNFSKKYTLKVKGGWVEDRLLKINELDELSKLPSKNQLIAIFMATLNAPLKNFLYACNDTIGRFIRALNAIAEAKK